MIACVGRGSANLPSTDLNEQEAFKMADTNSTTFSQMVNREIFQAKALAGETTILLENYFRGIKSRHDSGEAYPYEIDEMVPTVFSSKQKAVDALLRDFTQDVDFRRSTVRLGENPTPKELYSLTPLAFEFMVARKSKPIFEIYHRVFHVATTRPLSPAEIILQQAQMLVEQERRLSEIDDRVKRVECKQQAFEDGVRYFTVIGYVGYKGLPAVNMSQAQKLGKIAKKLSTERNISVDRVKDQRHGYVGSYHETVLDDAYAALLEAVE
jgi:hypothetical protein